MRNTQRVWRVALMTILCTVAHCVGAAEALIVNGAGDLGPLLAPIKEKHKVPGMAAAIVTQSGLVSIAAVGVRKHGSPELVTTNDLWHLGSDTKIMTSTLIARLVEQGQLQWDTSAASVFPEIAGAFHRDFTNVSLLQLLSHRAGLEANLNWSKLSRKGTVQEQRLQAVKDGLERKPRSRPGSTFHYSNLGYVIAGAMVERVTGKSWEAAIRAEVFLPLGMKSAGFGGVGTPGRLDQPWGHTKAGKPVQENGPDADNPPLLGPAGRVHCTLQDWARFIADQLRGLRGEPALLQPTSYTMLATPHFGGDYALGWAALERSWAKGTAFNHSGCNTMMFANAWLAPKRNFAILVCANLGEDAFPATDEAVAALIAPAIRAAKATNDAGEAL